MSASDVFFISHKNFCSPVESDLNIIFVFIYKLGAWSEHANFKEGITNCK